MSLTFVRRFNEFSTYRDAHGVLVYLANLANDEAPFTRFVFHEDWDIDAIRAYWTDGDQWQSVGVDPQPWLPTARREEFLEFLRAVLVNANDADELRWCESCEQVTHSDDGKTVVDGNFVCEPCINDHYSYCNHCTGWATDTSYASNGYYVCDVCRELHYAFCEECDYYYYPTNGGDDHSHGYGCCESPALSFTVRNDGDPPLANDELVTITLPAGVIDDEGIARIRNHLQTQNMWDTSSLVSTLDPRWQTKQGNFTRRLSKAAYETYKEKITPQVLSQVGCIASEHSKSTTVDIETTRDLNLPPGDFAHEDSCWWQSYYHGRCALKTNGGFALRSFSDGGWVTGRAWVMPLRLDADGNLKPTFETMTPDAFMVFNGYGDLDNYTPARIVAHMAGWTYRKIGFTCRPMFVNNETGYLIAPEEIATHYTNGELHLSVDQHADLFATETGLELADVS